MKTVIAFGVFDLFHPGHEWFLREAAKLGDRLIVIVARDQNTEMNKGRAPVWDEERRRKTVEAFDSVDEAHLGRKDWTKRLEILEEFHPDVVAQGYDQHFKLPKGDWKVVQIGAFQPETYKSSILRDKS